MILGTSVVVVQLGSLPGGVTSRRTVSTSVSEDGRRRDTVDQLELLFYETQLELYDTKFEVLKNEEQLLVAQIDSVRRQIKGGPHTLSEEWGGGVQTRQHLPNWSAMFSSALKRSRSLWERY